MTNLYFILHDLTNNTETRIAGYGAYIEYFKNVLLPDGLGTRYLFSEVTRKQQIYHYCIVSEKPGYIGYVRNRLAPKR